MSVKITKELLEELFIFDENVNRFIWKNNRGGRNIKGKYASRIENTGYFMIKIFGKRYLEHRLIWLWFNGYLPENGLDHIDRDPTNNNINNLREISQTCNLINNGLRKDNKTGIKGITLCLKSGKYYSKIRVNKKLINLGYFSDIIEAAAHRLAAEQALGWEGCDSNSSSFTCISNYVSKSS